MTTTTTPATQGNSGPATYEEVTAYGCVHHSPPGWLSMLDVSEANKAGVGKIYQGAFGRRIVRYWHPLGCRAIELGKAAPGVCGVHRQIR